MKAQGNVYFLGLFLSPYGTESRSTKRQRIKGWRLPFSWQTPKETLLKTKICP
jgi:hypothetical protein